MSQAVQTGVMGTWEGVTAILGLTGPVVLRIEEGAASIDFPAIGGVALPVTDVRVGEASVEGTAVSMRLRLRLNDAGDGLVGEASGRHGSTPIELRREHPDVARYRTPRSGPTGEALATWSFEPPTESDDGWPVAALDEAGVDPAPLASMGAAIVEGRYPHVDAVLLARNGRIAVEEYFHNHGRDQLHTFQSCTKKVTSLVFGTLVDRGLIPSLDEPVWRFFPERTGHRWIDERYDVTVHQLLAMSVGLDWNEEVHYTDQTNDNTRMNASGDWVGYVLDRRLRPDWPAGRFEYQSGLTILIGAVVRQATGRYIDDIAADDLFGPLGITRFRWLAAPDGTRHTGGGLFLRSRDMLKLGQLVLDRGMWQGRRVLSEEWLETSTSEQSRSGDTSYGYQWWLTEFRVGDRRVKAITAGGYGGQFLHAVPELDAVIVTNAHDFYGDGSYRQLVEQHLLAACR